MLAPNSPAVAAMPRRWYQAGYQPQEGLRETYLNMQFFYALKH